MICKIKYYLKLKLIAYYFLSMKRPTCCTVAFDRQCVTSVFPNVLPTFSLFDTYAIVRIEPFLPIAKTKNITFYQNIEKIKT